MNHSRLVGLSALVATGVTIAVVAVVLPSAATPSQERAIGVFPLRLVGAPAEQLDGRGFGGWLAERVIDSAGASPTLTPLPWPGDEDCASCPVGFGTLLAVARAAGVHGFVLGTVTLLEATEENIGPNAAGRVAGRFGLGRGRDRRKATVRVALEGGLIDSGSGEVVAAVRGEADGEEDDYRGPDIAEVLARGRSHPGLSQTPLWATAEEAAAALVATVASGAAELSGSTRPQPRPGAPAGLAFTRARMDAAIEPADNQWLSVEVHNGGTAPRRFRLAADSTDDLVVGFMGRGSADFPATLEPGEWKQVRMVVTAGAATEPAYDVGIRLHDLDAGDTVHDQAVVRLTLARDAMRLAVEEVAESEVTLARRYRLTNVGSQPLTDLTIAPDAGGTALFVHPAVQHATLAAGATLEITVGPLLSAGFREASGNVTIRSAAGRQPLPVSFAVPDGHQVWLASGNSRRDWMTELGFCTNRGAEEAEIAGPAMGVFECAVLGMRIASYEKTRGFYENAPEHRDYSGWNDDDLQQWVLDQSGGTVGGTTDGATGDVNCREEVFVGAGERINGWELEACFAHENLHATEHVSESQDIVDRANANNWAQSQFDSAMRDHVREAEMEAYDDTLARLRQKYAENCSWGGGGGVPFAALRTSDLSTRATAAAPGFNVDAGSDTEPGAARAGVYRTTIHVPSGALPGGPVLLAANFDLAYSRDTYTPHDTRVLFNDREVGALTNTVPEGRYLFEIDPSWLDVGGNNRVRIEVEKMNWSHYLVASRVGLSAPVTDADRMVIATSQSEADRLYSGIAEINHGHPDLTVSVTPDAALPSAPDDGEIVTIPVRVMNVAEVPSPGGLLHVHNESLTEAGDGSSGAPSAAVMEYLRDAARARPVGTPIEIPPLQPFESIDIPVRFEYERAKMSRLVFAAEIAGDFDLSDNAMPFTFVAPDLATPLLGTDYPDLALAPVLSGVLEPPASPEIQAQQTIALERFLGGLDYLDDVAGALRGMLRLPR